MTKNLRSVKKQLTGASEPNSPSLQGFTRLRVNRFYKDLPKPTVKVIPVDLASFSIVKDAQKRFNRSQWALMGLLALLTGLMYPARNNSIGPPTNTVSSGPVNMDPFDGGSPARANHWIYTDRVHPKHGRLYWAEVASTNALSFELPYNSGSIGYLTIGKKRSRTRMVLRIEKGLFSPKVIVGESIRLQLDNLPAATVSIRHAFVYGRRLIYIPVDGKFVSALQKAKKMSVEVGFYGEPIKQLEFQVEGLKWPH
jgi:hypothetical protein